MAIATNMGSVRATMAGAEIAAIAMQAPVMRSARPAAQVRQFGTVSAVSHSPLAPIQDSALAMITGLGQNVTSGRGSVAQPV
jgi:hypothetical protein